MTQPDAESRNRIPPDAPVGAAVDVGATSVHLLVAAINRHRLAPILDESEFLGLGDRVSSHGYLGAAVRAELAAALSRYADLARAHGAAKLTFVATEPLRRAADGAAAVRAAEDASGVALHVLNHREEGTLTLLGVRMGRRLARGLVVVDIGGGSSEIVALGPGRVLIAHGVALGSASLTQRFAVSDPPERSDIDAMAAEARRVMAGAPEAEAAELVAVGGTASNLLRVLPAAAADATLTRRRVAAALRILASRPAALTADRFEVHPTRARILPAGAVIVRAVLERYGADRMRVSEEGIREGAILAAARAGRAWRDRLPELARGWR